MKEFWAAPANGLPSEPTALVAQLSAMHFFMNEVLAAPASGLPSLPMALLSQVSCANAEPAAKVAITAARNMRFIVFLPKPERSGIGPWNHRAIKLGKPECIAKIACQRPLSHAAFEQRLEIGAGALRFGARGLAGFAKPE